MTATTEQIAAAYRQVRGELLKRRTADGHWVGELSSSALSTATAVAALVTSGSSRRDLVDSGLSWLVDNQNPDGGWGDTVRSFSNISTTMLCRAAFHIAGKAAANATTLSRCEAWLADRYGRSPEDLAEAVRARYGADRTFSVPILMMCALGRLIAWKEVPRLPFEAATLPQSWYRFARMPVVSYALPALIAIGQVIHHHRPTWNPLIAIPRKLARRRTLNVLRRIQPSSGGYLEATPLTSFVVMSLSSCGQKDHAVVRDGVRFLTDSVRPDGSWPIDTDLSIWVTTLAVNALASAGDLDSLVGRDGLVRWLFAQQLRERHPYTGAAPGAWGWSDKPGSVPDCDDTPGALLALNNLLGDASADADTTSRIADGLRWMRDLQNRDGGIPTFCRGWGKLPFDRSGTDLTAHAVRAHVAWNTPQNLGFLRRHMAYLKGTQRPDGSWLPLWFGNQHVADDINPVYGTCRVLAAYRDLGLSKSDECRRGVAFLLAQQNADGGWGGAAGTPSSVEETSLVVEVLLHLAPSDAVSRGVAYLVGRVDAGTITEPGPIGFYFAKLWYFEELYPIVFAVAALGKAHRLATKVT
jgi:squalene-hopene/tetraprenyl-beta-curcumene cyclase